MKTPITELKAHIQNMVDNGGDMDLLSVIGIIDEKYLAKEKAIIAEAYDTGYNDGYHDYCEDGENYYTEKFTQK